MEIKIVENVLGDDIGPELIVHWYDPEVKVKGVMVVDSLALGMATGGPGCCPTSLPMRSSFVREQ